MHGRAISSDICVWGGVGGGWGCESDDTVSKSGQCHPSPRGRKRSARATPGDIAVESEGGSLGAHGVVYLTWTPGMSPSAAASQEEEEPMVVSLVTLVTMTLWPQPALGMGATRVVPRLNPGIIMT